MYECVHACMHACVCVHVHVYARTCVCMCTCICACMWHARGMFTSMCVHVQYMCIRVSGLYAEILQRGDELGVFKKEGGTSASSIRGALEDNVKN